ncbi:MAG: TetR/AcrR family transcriptional regulator [Actinobacteria bacterium]|nr:TetR/AcrR family transcriptional regulator [Actinomycetota bacterium]MBV8561533.1 TetR/AcrR family transcriptional regulator [Actinomycetota bacterium]
MAISTRKDAQRNREAILAAARSLFSESGDVAMLDIAKRAGVGQATVYRNFADRDALVAALSEEWIEELERVAADHADEPDGFFVVMRSLVDTMARFHGLVQCAHAGGEAFAPLQRRLEDVIARGLKQAKAAGYVRPDLTVDDMLLLLSMIDGALAREHDPAARASTATRVLSLAIEGFSTRR